jgi:CsoR family transcriptional regulator, copper-sensing transcriptional repressor
MIVAAMTPGSAALRVAGVRSGARLVSDVGLALGELLVLTLLVHRLHPPKRTSRLHSTPLGYTVNRRIAKGNRMRGYTISKDDYLKRLRRIEGQVRGLQRMIEEDTYCIDVLTQVSAVTKALQSVSVGLLDEHVRHCVREATASGEETRADEMVTEATKAIERLLRS